MNKGLWLTIGLLVLLAGSLVGLRSLYQPAISADALSGVGADTTTKVMMSLDKFTGFHHDAEIILEKLTVLKTGLESAIDTKDVSLLGSTVNNTYRVMDSVSVNRMPTIAPFKICDEALNTLATYAVASKTYYSGSNNIDTDQIDAMRNTFNSQFDQCQSIVNDKSVESLYQDYQ